MTEADKPQNTSEDLQKEVPADTAHRTPEEETVAEEVAAVEAFEGEEPAESEDFPESAGAHAAVGTGPQRKRTGLIVGIIVAVVVVIAIIVALMPTILTSIGRSQLTDVVWPEDAKTVEYDGVTYEYDPNVVSVCVIGNDRARHTPTEEFNGQADAVIVAAVNTDTGEVSCISIPRNTMVEGWSSFESDPAMRSTETEQLCLVYSHGKSDEFSSENICHSVSDILGVPIKNYFTVQEEAIGALADAVGGVTLVPTVTIPDTVIVAGEEIVLKGPENWEVTDRTIYGGSAMDYTIWRDKSEDESSVHRGERQLQFIKAFIPQTMEKIKSDPALIMRLYNVVAEYATTNLDLPEFSYLASALSDRGTLDLNMVALPGETRLNNVYDDVYWEEVYLDEDAVKRIVLDIFYNPAS